MKTYHLEEINSLIKRFEARELPKVEWTHEAHLVVAIWYCFNKSVEEALPIVRQNITKHNESVGTINSKTAGYHETITKFWLIIAKQFIEKEGNSSIEELCYNFIHSRLAHKDYPLEFYSREHLFTVEARLNWVDPNLKKL